MLLNIKHQLSCCGQTEVNRARNEPLYQQHSDHGHVDDRFAHLLSPVSYDCLRYKTESIQARLIPEQPFCQSFHDGMMLFAAKPLLYLIKADMLRTCHGGCLSQYPIN